MTTKTIYHCNDCGSEISEAQAGLYAGIHVGATAAAGGDSFWHSCSAECAANHLRAVADKVLVHAEVWRAKQAEVDKNREDFARATAPVGTRVPNS